MQSAADSIKLTWAKTRNMLEAAALAAVGIGSKPVGAINERSGKRTQEWLLEPQSQPQAPGAGQTLFTSALRKETASGALEKAAPLHPYLNALRTLRNRQSLLAMIKEGKIYDLVEEAPGVWVLVPGQGSLRPPNPLGADLTATLADLDLVIAAVTMGCRILQIAKKDDGHIFTLERFAAIGAWGEIGRPQRPDIAHLVPLYRSGRLYTEAPTSIFAQALHALRCLREVRRHQRSNTFLVVAHRTPTHKGAAVKMDDKENASGHILHRVERQLGRRINA